MSHSSSPTAPTWVPFHGVTAFFRHPPAPSWAPHSLQGVSAPHGPPCAAGALLPLHGLHRGLQGNPSSGETPDPSSPLILESAGLFLSQVLTLLSSCRCTGFIPLFLNLLSQKFHHRPRWTQPRPWQVQEPAGVHSGKLLEVSHTSHPSPPATRICPHKPISLLV